MFTSKILNSDKVSDRDIFNYITEQMLKQGVKSLEQWYDEDNEMVEDGDNCQYFGYDMRTESSLRCAVGWIMDPKVFDYYQNERNIEIENTGISQQEPLEVVILSNENWRFTKESWVMLSVMQRIHDNSDPEDWKNIFLNMSYLFDSDGRFCPNHVTKDSYGNIVEQEKLYLGSEYAYGSPQEEKALFVDFEELGVSFKILHHNPHVVTKISDAIKSEKFSDCIDKEAISLNILDAEDQQTADTSAMNFLDIMDAVRMNKQEKDLIPNG